MDSSAPVNRQEDRLRVKKKNNQNINYKIKRSHSFSVDFHFPDEAHNVVRRNKKLRFVSYLPFG